MPELKEILTEMKTLVIFREILAKPVVSKLLYALVACDNAEKNNSLKDNAITAYSDFASELYKHTDNLTDFVLKLILEDENLYMLRRGEGKQTGILLDECLANELCVIERLASIESEKLAEYIDFNGFLPNWKTSKLDFSKIYADRIHNISNFGYGIYANYHVFVMKNNTITPVEYPDSISLKQLSGYERERKEVIDNTIALINGKPANNVLLYGDCGTGKSSTVKAVANEFKDNGLRLIELKKKQLHALPDIVETISRNPLKFIIFIDDLSFSEDDDDFAALKAILEGSVSSTASNLVVYATSNRRHLVKECFSDREGDDIHFQDTMQELLSLSDRFGITITFSKPDKRLYLDVVKDLAEQYEIKTSIDEVLKKAEIFALNRGGRSPRAAKQFIEFMKGSEN